MERQGDKASPRASSRPRFIAEAQPQHHPGTGQTERESHPHADQSPAQHKTAKISYGQRYNKTSNPQLSSSASFLRLNVLSSLN